jgi:hypothetical protein
MIRNRPPLLARFLLRRLNAGPSTEALEGDLHEAWNGGCGRAWYWRQVLIAVSPVRVSVRPTIKWVATVAAFGITAIVALLIIIWARP